MPVRGRRGNPLLPRFAETVPMAARREFPRAAKVDMAPSAVRSTRMILIMGPIDPNDRSVVGAGFRAACAADRPLAEYCCTGVEAWQRLHPEHVGAYAAHQAISIMPSERMRHMHLPSGGEHPELLGRR